MTHDQEHWQDEDTALLAAWPAQEAPAGFAEGVVHQLVAERRSKRVSRAWIAPFFLAAIFVSWGASAAWGAFQKPPQSTDQESNTPLTSSTPPSVARPLPVGEPSAEPDVAEAERTPRRPSRLKDAPPTELTTEPPEEGHELHLPACECSPGATICHCYH